VQDYLASRMEKRLSGQPNLVVFCYGGSNSMKELDQPQSESGLIFLLLDDIKNVLLKSYLFQIYLYIYIYIYIY
jgi:hypothetical protein